MCQGSCRGIVWFAARAKDFLGLPPPCQTRHANAVLIERCLWLQIVSVSLGRVLFLWDTQRAVCILAISLLPACAAVAAVNSDRRVWLNLNTLCRWRWIYGAHMSLSVDCSSVLSLSLSLSCILSLHSRERFVCVWHVSPRCGRSKNSCISICRGQHLEEDAAALVLSLSLSDLLRFLTHALPLCLSLQI